MCWEHSPRVNGLYAAGGEGGSGCHGRLSKEGEQELGRETRGVMGGR